MTFKAIVIDKEGSATCARLVDVANDALPAGDVAIDVSHSTLNYKDALAITGRAPIARSFPMVPGIDLAGIVSHSDNPRFKAGDRVLLNGFGIGESRWGGLAERARVSGDWLIPIPAPFSAAQAMALGTAGYTAMLCVMALQRLGLTPEKGPVLVTGAGGGVGGVAIQILHRAGYRVIASTGRPAEAAYLHELGADAVIDRAELSGPGKPLAKARWAGAIDSAGSHTLANACAATLDDGVVAACGLAQGMDFPGSVAPFILRGVTLVGINSVYRSLADREEAWSRLARDIDGTRLERMTRTIPLAAAIPAAADLIGGKVRGRLVVAM